MVPGRRGDPRVDSPDDTVLTCYAESQDGIVWEKPSLGRYEFEGSTDNNILGPPEDFTNISVLLDANQEKGQRDSLQDDLPGRRYLRIRLT